MNILLDELLFIYDQIEKKNYTKLPETIAIGDVYKISAFGNLEKDGFEVGYLYLPVGSGIKEHIHINDIERYKLLSGCLKINGSTSDVNICMLNNSHCIDIVSEPTIIQTCKVSKKFLNLLNDFSNESFENIINKKTSKIKMKQ